MQFLKLIRLSAGPAVLGAITLHASSALAIQSLSASAMPVLLAQKSWLTGYALVFLAILLGLLAVLLPSMRKVLRKRDI